MTTIISITNQKGGVGKTTTSINLAASLAKAHRRVLLIDFDPQGNATMGSGVNKHGGEKNANEFLLKQASFEETVQTSAGGYDILPANGRLTMAEVQLLHQEQKEWRLKTLLETLPTTYDFILIDCPPSMNMLTVNALIASNSVIIPMQCEYFALEGLSGLLQTIERLTQSLNPGLEIEGILRTMYDGRNRLAIDVSEELLKHFGDRVFRTVIPRNVRLAEAPSHGLPALQYDKFSQGALAYLTLAGEVIRRHEIKAQMVAKLPLAEKA